MGEVREETGPWEIKKPDRWETKAKGFLMAENTNCSVMGDIQWWALHLNQMSRNISAFTFLRP